MKAITLLYPSLGKALLVAALVASLPALAAQAPPHTGSVRVGDNETRWFDLPFLLEQSRTAADRVQTPLVLAQRGANRAKPAATHALSGHAVSGTGPALRATASHFHVCCFSYSMSAVDLTGSGHLDLVTGNGLSADISVLLSNGAGGFAEPVTLPVNTPTIYRVVIATGDVSGDGHPDIVAAGFNETDIVLYIGDGAGGFTGPTTLNVGAGSLPWAITLADVDGDTNLDIVTANNDTANVSVLLGDGAGGFADAANFAGGAHPVSVAVADVTGDGNMDIVSANAGTLDVSILAGDGAGGFAAPVSASIGADAEPHAIAIADLTGDGKLDIVTANAALDGSPFPPPELPGTVSILVNDGSGSFAPAVQLSTGDGEGRAESVALGDVTGDGNTDIVVSRPNANSAAVLAGDGAGAFLAAVTTPTGIGPTPVVVADVTGDGHADVVTANAVGSNISVLPGDGAGGVGFEGNYDVGKYPHSVAAVDLDGDGHADVVTANAMSSDVSVRISDGSGGFEPEVHYAVGNSPTGVTIGDVDDDGSPDIVTADLGGGEVSVLLNDGAGGFAEAMNFSIGEGFQSPYAVALADADGDGDLDIATANTNVSNESISYLAGDGTGQFAAAVMYPLGEPGYYSPQGVAFADVTGDGHADIVTANLGASNLSLLAGDGAGNFAAAVLLPTDFGPVVVAAADVTGDGAIDLITVNQSAQSVSVLAGDAHGNFGASMNYAIYPETFVQDYMPWPWGMTLGDINGDGMLDIVTANTQNDTITVLPNDGAGGFGAFFNFDTGAHPGSVAVADMDGDGDLDVVTANRDNNNISVMINEASRADAIFADGFDIIPL